MSWADSAADGATGGRGGYGGSNTGSGHGGGFDGRDTPGAPNAADGRRGSSMGPDGGRAGGGGSAGGNASSSASNSRSDMAGSRSVSPEAVSAARDVAGVSVGALTDGAIASFTDELETDGRYGTFAEQADTQMGPENVSYGNTAYSGNSAVSNASQAAQMTRDQHTRSMERAGVPETIQANARPGLLSRAAVLGVSLLGSPIAGLLADTAARANTASRSLGSINDSFGTSLDDSFSNSFGQQAKGAVGGFAGGRLGGLLGGRLGSTLGVPGAVAGSVAGTALASNYGRNAAMGPSTSTAPGQPSGTTSPSSPGDAYGGGGETAVASRAPSLYGQPGPAAVDHGPIDFAGYASYAEQFFA